MSRAALVLVAAAGSVAGCDRFTVRTQNRVAFDGPVETRVSGDLPPVSPFAGPVRPVVVQPGPAAARVAIVDVDGLVLNTPFAGFGSVGENPVAAFREKLDAAEADRCVRAVVLRVNSPGGGVAACQAMRRDLDRFRARAGKPVVACLLDVGAGGAYLVAAGADLVVATPGTVTGGLGVILNLYNLRETMGLANVQPQPIQAGQYADFGSATRSLVAPDRAEERDLLQAQANEFHAQIRADVLRARPAANPDGATFDGRTFTASQAIGRGLVDRVGDLDEAILTAAEMAGAGRPQAVLYRRANDPAHSIYAVTANVPLQGAGLFPSLPGLDRTKLPTFLSLWQPEPTAERLGGK